MYTAERKFKVLIVDDSPVARKFVEMPLAEKGYSLIFATNGRTAIELFEQHRPDVVITDWVMSDLTGQEFCQAIRAKSGDSYTYIIVLTGRTDKNSVMEALAAGADEHLTKPIHRQELLARVNVGTRIIGLQRQFETKSKQLEALALTDALTGLPNRRAIENWATTQLKSAVRHGFPFWVVIADLDHFKQVNDTFGHEAGDMVLKSFAKILKRCSRREDLCGRLGGEEFLLVLTYASQENALAVIERIRAELSNTPLSIDGYTVAVTASFGFAGFARGEKASTFSNLRALADAALYSAKSAGRNRVEMMPLPAYQAASGNL